MHEDAKTEQNGLYCDSSSVAHAVSPLNAPAYLQNNIIYPTIDDFIRKSSRYDGYYEPIYRVWFYNTISNIEITPKKLSSGA